MYTLHSRINLSRRRVLASGGRLVLASTAVGALHALGLAGRADALDWDALFRTMVSGGFGVVVHLRGAAFAKAGDSPLRQLSEGDRVNSGETVRGSKGGRVEVLLSDDTALRINGAAELEIKLDDRGRGVLRLLFGNVLAAVPSGRRYLVQGESATVGIKGTVCYREIFPPEMSYGTAMDGSRVNVPQHGRDYFCTCHGAVEYLHPGTKAQVFEDTTDYHSAYFLNPAMPDMKEMALNALNHTDPDIRELVRLQKRPHDISWLRG